MKQLPLEGFPEEQPPPLAHELLDMDRELYNSMQDFAYGIPHFSDFYELNEQFNTFVGVLTLRTHKTQRRFIKEHLLPALYDAYSSYIELLEG